MRPRFLLRNAADIGHLRTHLLVHWKLPGIRVDIDELPVLDSQQAQDRLVRLANGCNCTLGEALAAMTLLGGSFMAWTSILKSWQFLGPVLIAALGVGLAGKAVELAWMRVRMLLVLRNLRLRLADVAAGRPLKRLVKTSNPAREIFSSTVDNPNRDTLPVADVDLAQGNAIPRSRSSRQSKRQPALLRNPADIDRMILQLATRWRLPRMEVRLDALPALDQQRAQDQLTRLSQGCNYLLAAMLATATLLGGLFYVVWIYSQNEEASPGESWGDAGMVLVLTLCAALAGWLIEASWIRTQRLLVLLNLRGRL